MTMRIPLTDLSNLRARLSGLYPGYVKRNGAKTDAPLLDAETGKRVWWASLKLFPSSSAGGEDVEVFARCVSDEEPLALGAGEKPLVELVAPAVVLDDRGFSLVIGGLKRVPEPKAKQ